MTPSATTLVLRDLLDAAVAEDLAGLGGARLTPAPDGWPGPCVRLPLPDGRCVGWPARPGGVLQATRYVDGPVLVGVPGEPLREVAGPAELVDLLFPEAPAREVVARDLATAVAHAEVAGPPAGALSEGVGEQLAVARGRPFHPTARAVVGWGTDELARFGPGRLVDLDWVGVRRDHVRRGEGPAPRWDVECPDTHVPVPVHPFDREHVLPVAFAPEFADGTVVALARGIGQGRATASLRTLDLGGGVHLKLPLGVTTLGSARLLPARSLDHAQRGQRVLRDVLDADPDLAARVAVADETSWVGFARPGGGDEFHERPGHLAAVVRRLPAGGGAVRVPLAALAAPAWDGSLAELGDPAAVFAAVAEAVVEVGIGFLRHGVLPEMHGQNVLLELSDGRSVRLVLRDHDAVRVHPRWLSVPDPGYRLAPGGSQSLVLDTPGALIGFFATLGLQVGLGGVVDALVRHTGTLEPRWWSVIRHAVEASVERTRSPVVRQTLHAALLDAESWPYRAVLGPLLKQGPSRGTSMPAGTTWVANPLRAVP
ncbi:IucA/IucC family protein [Actinomycetospora cinnamomea]|uniref:Siderophore synthetase component n=1 Tax=Actinomycetospora cinnamomea TaxID=663609 RepID=A0A2U1F144_9PSEU|nr:IucA/IucC family protein [Actinomycetospora cinnamomea]PVZ05891.1 siderophore synthetase component [Actinomycetospora cinnamomea]